MRLALPLACVLFFLSTPGMAQRPNVVVFFIDDLGWADVSCYGSTFYATPQIDKLARSGVRFTDAYAACPVCSPTRAALMTGKYPQRVGITQWIPPGSPKHIAPEEETLGEAYQDAGYHTAFIGKWHLGEKDANLPDRHGFSWTFAVNRAGQPSSYHFPYRRKPAGKRGIVERNGKRGTVWDVPDLEDGQAGDYLTDALTDAAIRFITRERDEEKPFFLCFSHYAVHTPIQPPPALVPEWEKKRKALGKNLKPLPGPLGTRSRARQDNPRYAAMIENLDTNIGRVLDALKQAKLSERTIVVFTSDNGGLCTLKRRPGPTSNLPLLAGKGWTYEGGIRVPLIVSWPGQIAPGVSRVPAITMDLYPTLLDLCKLPSMPKQHRDGVSLSGPLAGEPGDLAERMLGWSYPHPHGSGHRPSAALRKDGWKLVRFINEGITELYHLDKDPGETRNLAERKPDTVRELSALLDEWLVETSTSR